MNRTIMSAIRDFSLCIVCATALIVCTTACSLSGDGKETEHGHDHEEGGHEGHDHEEGGHEGHDHEEGEHEGDDHEDGAVHLSDDMKKTAGIVVAAVQKGVLHAGISAPAHVLPTQEGKAHVGTPLAGRITRLHAAEGTLVAKGTVLAEVEAPGVAELQSDYFRAAAEVERAQAELKRNETLGEERIGSRRSLEEARSAWRQATALRQSIAAQLQTAGISPEEIDKSGTITSRIYLRAPVAGVVSRRHVALGEYLQPDRDAFEIVNTATVWVDARVQPERVEVLHVGETATVRSGGGEQRKGKIVYIAPVVDSSSRTVTVRLLVENRDNAFRPQSYATVEFRSTNGGEALVVPRRALETEGGTYFVYREVSDGFERVQVAVGSTSEQDAEITEGIEEGWRIAVDGVFYLKSMRKSGELAEHHH